MTIRIAIGTTVHKISIKVLWVVRDGIGLARALKRTITMTSRISTKAVIAEIHQSKKSWNQMMRSITGVADCCRPSCQGAGCPNSASAASPPARTATIATANAVNRLNTSIVGVAPSTR